MVDMRLTIARAMPFLSLVLATAAVSPERAHNVTQTVTQPATASAQPAAAVDETALASMPAKARDQVAAAPVPVLAPAEPQLLEQAKVTIGNGYYSLSSATNGVTLVIQGTPLSQDTGTLAGAPVSPTIVGNRRVFATANEGIRSATWVERGVAYSLDVECNNPSDRRCASDEYVLSLVSKLALLGGRR